MRLCLLAALPIMLLGCGSTAPPLGASSHRPTTRPSASSAPRLATPCELSRPMRERGEKLARDGFMHRAKRVLDRADTQCATESARSRAARLAIDSVLGVDVRALVDAFEKERKPSGEERELLAVARAWSELPAPDAKFEEAGAKLRRARAMERKGSLADAETLALETWKATRPNGEALALAGSLAKQRGELAEAHRRFSRAHVELEQRTGKKLVLDRTPESRVRSVMLTSDGDAAIADVDIELPPPAPPYQHVSQTLLVDPVSHTIRRFLPGSGDGHLELLHDGHLLVRRIGEEIAFFDVDRNEVTKTIAAPSSAPILSWSISPDERAMAIVDEAHAYVIDMSTGKRRWTQPVKSPWYFLEWSHGGKRLVTAQQRSCNYAQCGHDITWNVLEIRDAKTGKIEGRIKTESGSDPAALEFTPDDARMLTSSPWGPAVSVFDGKTGRSLGTVDEAHLESNRDAATIRLLSKQIDKVTAFPHGARLPIEIVASSDDGSDTLLTVRTADDVRTWSLEGRSLLARRKAPPVHEKPYANHPLHTGSAGIFTADGKTFLVPHFDKPQVLELLDAKTFAVKRTIADVCHPAMRVSTDRSGSRIVMSCPYTSGVLYAGPTDATFRKIAGPPSRVQAVALNADGTAFAAIGGDAQLWAWKLDRSEVPVAPVTQKLGYTGPALTFSPDGRSIYVHVDGATMQRFDGLTFAPRETWKVSHFGGSMVVTPDGSRLISWGTSVGETFELPSLQHKGKIRTADYNTVDDISAAQLLGAGATTFVPMRMGSMQLTRVSDGAVLGELVAFAESDGGAFIDKTGAIELLGGATTFESATCRYGEIGVAFEACADVLLDDGMLRRRLRGDDEPFPP